MKKFLHNRVVREWLFVIAGLGFLLVANVMTPWENSTFLTVILAVIGVILLVKGGECHGRNTTKRYYGIKDKNPTNDTEITDHRL